MTGTEALVLAAEHGVRVRREGSGLHLTASKQPPEVVLVTLREAKADILRLFRSEAKSAAPAVLDGAADCPEPEHGGALDALVEDTARRARAATAPPADTEEASFAAAERTAIMAEDGGGLPDPWPELATLGAGCHAAFTSCPGGGSVEVRHRSIDGTWSAPVLLPALGTTRGQHEHDPAEPCPAFRLAMTARAAAAGGNKICTAPSASSRPPPSRGRDGSA